MEHVYRKERPLFIVVSIISAILWLALVGVTFGIALIYILLGGLIYLFLQSAFISWIRGNGVEVTDQQYPEVHRQFLECCSKLGIEKPPYLYIMNSDGILNALATRFLGRNYVVLYSEIVEALEDRPESLKFYLGHELCHIQRNHLGWGPFLMPGMLIPHLGTAYSRAREYTCDLYGLACCQSVEDAEIALAVLASGDSLWKRVNIQKLREQKAITGGFWMSFHEYTGDYPWLVKRIESVRAYAEKRPRDVPRRSFFAFLLGCFVPRVGAAGGGMGAIVFIAMIGVLAAVAIPAYQDYVVRAQVSSGVMAAQPVNQQLVEYYARTETWPETLAETGYTGQLSGEYVSEMYLDSDQDLVVVFGNKANARIAGKMIYFTPYRNDDGRISMACGNLSLDEKLLPQMCRR